MEKTYPTPEEQITFLTELLTEKQLEEFNQYLSNYENKD